MSNDATRPGDPPLISLVVTSYEQQHIVAEAVKGALGQDYQPLEIIFTDDASTDGTFDVIRRITDGYAGPHRIVLNRNTKNLGIAANVDRAVSLAAGDLIVVAAGDDTSLPSRCRRIAEAWLATGRKADLVHSSCIQLGHPGEPPQEAKPPVETRTSPSPVAIAARYLYVIGATLAWTRRLHDRFGPLRGHADIEDHVIPFRAALCGGYAYIDEPLVEKRPGGVADLAVVQTGHDRVYGMHLRELRWKLADYRQFRADLRRIDHPLGADVEAIVEDRIACHAFELRLAEARFPAKFAMLGPAARFAWKRRDHRWLLRAALYASAPLSVWAYDLNRVLRHRRARASAAATDAAPGVPG